MPDVPTSQVGLSNYVHKLNWRREGFGKNSYEIQREGWDHFRPNGSSNAQSVIATGVSALQLFEARRPNGTVAIVAAASNGKIYAFSFSGAVWTQIGTGYSAPPSDKRWQIINVGPYVVFNNSVDLPFTWLIGDAVVKPIYEMRESGIASVGTIWEYNQILMVGDITMILEINLPGVLNSGSPYGLVSSGSTERIQSRIAWSNTGDPRDWASVVNGTTTASSYTLTLSNPMSSFVVGDEIIVVGAGPSGGNLTTVISSISGTSVIMANSASTSISGTPVSKSTAISSIVGYYEIEDDGAPIIRGLPLQNKLIVYKPNSIFTAYYTGDLDEPFVFERAYAGGRTPRFRWTLMDIGGKYHLYAGDKHFYRFSLGRPEPEIDDVLVDCELSLFFSHTVGENENRVWSAENATTNEVWFWPASAGAVEVLAYDYAHECASTVSGAIDVQCAATIHAPLTGNKCLEQELWFIMGLEDANTILKYGKTNLAVETYRRLGFVYVCELWTGLGDFGEPFNEKDVRSWAYLDSFPRDEAGEPSMAFHLYGADRNNQTPVLLESKLIEIDMVPTLVPLHYRKMYFQERTYLEPDADVDAAVTIQGRVWEVSRVRSRSITRIAGTS